MPEVDAALGRSPAALACRLPPPRPPGARHPAADTTGGHIEIVEAHVGSAVVEGIHVDRLVDELALRLDEQNTPVVSAPPPPTFLTITLVAPLAVPPIVVAVTVFSTVTATLSPKADQGAKPLFRCGPQQLTPAALPLVTPRRPPRHTGNADRCQRPADDSLRG